jgi:hypothetical protein
MLHSRDTANIRLGRNFLKQSNTLAYFTKADKVVNIENRRTQLKQADYLLPTFTLN